MRRWPLLLIASPAAVAVWSGWVGLGGLAIGFIPLVIYWAMGSAYFKQKPTLGSVLPEDAPGVQAP